MEWIVLFVVFAVAIVVAFHFAFDDGVLLLQTLKKPSSSSSLLLLIVFIFHLSFTTISSKWEKATTTVSDATAAAVNAIGYSSNLLLGVLMVVLFILLSRPHGREGVGKVRRRRSCGEDSVFGAADGHVLHHRCLCCH